MLTKKQFCWMIINDFLKKEPLDIFSIANLENGVTLSSSLAVALEYLGLIKNPDLKEYTKGRAGCIMCGEIQNPFSNDKRDTSILTTRQVLELLPD